jgi:copper chaperone CopZ
MMVQSPKSGGSAILRIKEGPSATPNYGKIRASLKKLRGMLSVSINEVTNVVKVEFDPALLTLDDVRKAIDTSGDSEKA